MSGVLVRLVRTLSVQVWSVAGRPRAGIIHAQQSPNPTSQRPPTANRQPPTANQANRTLAKTMFLISPQNAAPARLIPYPISSAIGPSVTMPKRAEGAAPEGSIARASTACLKKKGTWWDAIRVDFEIFEGGFRGNRRVGRVGLLSRCSLRWGSPLTCAAHLHGQQLGPHQQRHGQGDAALVLLVVCWGRGH